MARDRFSCAIQPGKHLEGLFLPVHIEFQVLDPGCHERIQWSLDPLLCCGHMLLARLFFIPFDVDPSRSGCVIVTDIHHLRPIPPRTGTGPGSLIGDLRNLGDEPFGRITILHRVVVAFADLFVVLHLVPKLKWRCADDLFELGPRFGKLRSKCLGVLTTRSDFGHGEVNGPVVVFRDARLDDEGTECILESLVEVIKNVVAFGHGGDCI